MTLSIRILFASALFAGGASASAVVRRSVAETNHRVYQQGKSSRAWAHKAQGLQKQGANFWRNIRKELEEKKKGIGRSARGSQLSQVAQRDAMWEAVEEVDSSYGRKFTCALEEGKIYSKEALFLKGQVTYSKENVATARECALMCAADSLAEHNPDFMACKSFTYNRTSRDCRFFNFAKQARSAWTEDTCCTSGPPCNLKSMRTEIRAHFVARLGSQKLPRSPKQNSFTKQHSIPKTDLTDRHKVGMDSSLASDAVVQNGIGPPKMTQLAELKKKHTDQVQPISNYISLHAAAKREAAEKQMKTVSVPTAKEVAVTTEPAVQAASAAAAVVVAAPSKASETAPAVVQQSSPQSQRSGWFSRILSFF
jgi:hypothetical protein